jgi:hypothetical protein
VFVGVQPDASDLLAHGASEQWKARGNRSFRSQQWEKAVEEYSKAITCLDHVRQLPEVRGITGG